MRFQLKYKDLEHIPNEAELEKQFYSDKKIYTLIIQQDKPFVEPPKMFDLSDIDGPYINIDTENIHSMYYIVDSKSIRYAIDKDDVLNILKDGDKK